MKLKSGITKSRSANAPVFLTQLSRKTPRFLAQPTALLIAGGLLSVSLAGCSGGNGGSDSGNITSFRAAGTFNVATNAGGQVAEIAAVSPDGNTLLYTDSQAGNIGILNISNLSAISVLGNIDLGGDEPTSVAVTPNGQLALAVVAGSPNRLVVINLATRTVARTLNLPGQPDCISISPNGGFAAIAIENERADEDDLLPQAPAGSLAIVNISEPVANWTVRNVALNLAGTAARFPTDPEPEFIDINNRNEAAVTLQENNAIAIVNLSSGTVTRVFSTGTTTHAADLNENGTASFTQTLTGARREPDGIAWTSQGNLITANEGDYDLDLASDQFVGGRNFTVFSPTGTVLFDDQGDMEKAVAAAGRYDDNRSENKGVEPENVEIGTFGFRQFAFVALERADSLAVYRLENDRAPQFVQILPTGDAPEGVVAVPARNLVITANEDDGTISFFQGS